MPCSKLCELLNFLVVLARGLVPRTAHVPHPTVALELGGHSLLLVPGPVCRLHCLDVLVEDKLATTLKTLKHNARSTIIGIARRIDLSEAEKKKKAPPPGVAAQVFKSAMGAIGMGGRGGAKLPACKLAAHGFTLFSN